MKAGSCSGPANACLRLSAGVLGALRWWRSLGHPSGGTSARRVAFAAEPSSPSPPPHPPCSLMALWGLISLSLHCWVCLCSTVTAASASSLPSDKPGGPLDWLLSDKGPFHHSSEYIDFVEKNRQGFSTRYKIYRWVPASRLLAFEAGHEPRSSHLLCPVWHQWKRKTFKTQKPSIRSCRKQAEVLV